MEILISTGPIPFSFITITKEKRVKTKGAEQRDDFSVNKLGHVQLKGKLEDNMTKEVCDKNVKVKQFLDKTK